MSLTNLSQIKGGLLLQQNVRALLESYDAAKVLTSIVKTEAAEGVEAVNYNADELLAKLKADLEAISGGEGTSLATLKEALDNLSGKKVQDIVRLELTVTDNVATIPEDLATKVPSVDTSKALPVYTVDNEVLFNENGEQLTVSLADGSFNGTPSVIDEAASAKTSDGSYVYKAANISAVKVFPQGEWTLADLPTDALLDNNEMQLVAYKSALNKLVVQLAKDEDIIEAVKAQIGEKAVKDQLDELTKTLTDEINKKFDKANVVTSDIDRSAEDYEVSDGKVLSEKAVAANIAAAKAEAISEAVDTVEKKAGSEQYDKIAVTGTDAVTEFELTQTPNTKLVQAIINHLVYLENEDFMVDRDTKKVTWTLTAANNGFDINEDLTDAVTFKYFF